MQSTSLNFLDVNPSFEGIYLFSTNRSGNFLHLSDFIFSFPLIIINGSLRSLTIQVCDLICLLSKAISHGATWIPNILFREIFPWPRARRITFSNANFRAVEFPILWNNTRIVAGRVIPWKVLKFVLPGLNGVK